MCDLFHSVQFGVQLYSAKFSAYNDSLNIALFVQTKHFFIDDLSTCLVDMLIYDNSVYLLLQYIFVYYKLLYSKLGLTIHYIFNGLLTMLKSI